MPTNTRPLATVGDPQTWSREMQLLTPQSALVVQVMPWSLRHTMRWRFVFQRSAPVLALRQCTAAELSPTSRRPSAVSVAELWMPRKFSSTSYVHFTLPLLGFTA